jgi:tetratricopeptide (TPR) repeat protein
VKADARMIRDQAVAWMNRGHELLLRDDRVSLQGALDAYAEAITLFRPLPLSENPSWTNSLGAALMNRGQLLHRLHGVTQSAPALAAFDEAVSLLRAMPASDNPWPRRNLAGTLLNRANLLLDLARREEASVSAREALVLCLPRERFESVDADLALKSRRVLCDALGQLIVTAGADQTALAAEASDLVDDALALIKDWTGRGENSFHSLALRFFRFGTQLYRFHQPHFLAEFIRENLSPTSAEFRLIALDVIEAALLDRPHDRPFLTMGDVASERRLQVWRDLAALRSLLAA